MAQAARAHLNPRVCEQLIGTSAAIRDALEDARYAASTDAKVLITGESGVGKEVLARLIHSTGVRSSGRFIPINCAGLPDSLLESELFGHVRGSFTGAFRDRAGLLEQAHGGTLFMDEVGEMSLRMQATLLRFLENGEIQPIGGDYRDSRVDVRIVAATNRNLLQRINEKNFREDLYYRLNVIHIPVPPLRERREDIPVLLDHFFHFYATTYRLGAPQPSREAWQRLLDYDWPGNVRELRNVVERLTIRAGGAEFGLAQLPVELRRREPEPEAAPAASPVVASRAASTADMLYDRMVRGGESFWSVVYEPFMARDLTREDLRQVVARGLTTTRGSYTALVRLFNIRSGEYKRFLNFLHKRGCHLPFQRFRLLDPVVSESGDSPRA